MKKKQERLNLSSNNVNSKKKDKLTKILGICAGVLFCLSFIILILGIILCFSDPITGDSISGLSFNLFGECAGIMGVISVVLVIFIVVLNVVELNKNKLN